MSTNRALGTKVATILRRMRILVTCTMAAERSPLRARWHFTKEEMRQTSYIVADLDSEKELSSRQQAAGLIQDIGQKLTVYVTPKWQI